jgi:hypothetical protein
MVWEKTSKTITKPMSQRNRSTCATGVKEVQENRCSLIAYLRRYNESSPEAMIYNGGMRKRNPVSLSWVKKGDREKREKKPGFSETHNDFSSHGNGYSPFSGTGSYPPG